MPNINIEKSISTCHRIGSPDGTPVADTNFMTIELIGPEYSTNKLKFTIQKRSRSTSFELSLDASCDLKILRETFQEIFDKLPYQVDPEKRILQKLSDHSDFYEFTLEGYVVKRGIAKTPKCLLEMLYHKHNIDNVEALQVFLDEFTKTFYADPEYKEFQEHHDKLEADAKEKDIQRNERIVKAMETYWEKLKTGKIPIFDPKLDQPE